jgi:hypothetical protein
MRVLTLGIWLLFCGVAQAQNAPNQSWGSGDSGLSTPGMHGDANDPNVPGSQGTGLNMPGMQPTGERQFDYQRDPYGGENQ